MWKESKQVSCVGVNCAVCHSEPVTNVNGVGIRILSVGATFAVAHTVDRNCYLLRMSAAATLEHKRFNDESKKKMPRDRVVKFTMASTKYSAPGSEGTGGSFRCFCLLLSLLTKVGRAGARNIFFRHSGIQILEISLITLRWVLLMTLRHMLHYPL